LGYYSRARNLKRAAVMLQAEFGGRFPETEKDLLRLPGVGEYTAGALLSICFEQAQPAVDGNALRVVSRLCGSAEPIDLPQTKRAVSAALQAAFPQNRKSDFTQAMMDLGATLCLPGNPKCEGCPVAGLCAAKKAGTAPSLPVKSPKKAKKEQEITLLLLEAPIGAAIRERNPRSNAAREYTHDDDFSKNDRIALRKRPDSGLLAGLFELPNAPGTLCAQAALTLAQRLGAKPLSLLEARKGTHVFTHIVWRMTCYRIRCAAPASEGALIWADRAALLDEYALPTAFRKFLL
jgi:A/G-specific adenine glycosylase